MLLRANIICFWLNCGNTQVHCTSLINKKSLINSRTRPLWSTDNKSKRQVRRRSLSFPFPLPILGRRLLLHLLLALLEHKRKLLLSYAQFSFSCYSVHSPIRFGNPIWKGQGFVNFSSLTHHISSLTTIYYLGNDHFHWGLKAHPWCNWRLAPSVFLHSSK